jgi:hypothetical protein
MLLASMPRAVRVCAGLASLLVSYGSVARRSVFILSRRSMRVLERCGRGWTLLKPSARRVLPSLLCQLCERATLASRP